MVISKRKRRRFTSAFKAEVAIEAIKERVPAHELAKRFELHPQQISAWKKEFLENSEAAFGHAFKEKEPTVDVEKLYAKIGQLEMERKFLKKACSNWRDENETRFGRSREQDVYPTPMRVAIPE